MLFGDKWIKVDEDGEEIEMIYLAEGISCTVHDWTECLRSKTERLFAKNILRNLYNNTELLRRCVSTDKNCKTPNGRNLCTSISPAKDKVIDVCMRYYIKKKRNKNIRKIELDEWVKREKNPALTEVINQVKDYHLDFHLNLFNGDATCGNMFTQLCTS
ncbi:uncharacterized protein LOC143901447 [Temnothorax americanus]|uniref:uncharacterized protein LOC143901447 n=1 Tax=Temnothorax americanus TaxID=1964332 RepID=UPI004069621A